MSEFECLLMCFSLIICVFLTSIRVYTQASVSCALHFVVPGFMKAGTTYLFGSLMSHPQLLNTLRGVTFKETGCYGVDFTQPKLRKKASVDGTITMVAENLASHNRMHCFPFVEAHEPMYFGDGTVWYNSHEDIPHYLLADNPDVKVIFSVRNPVHRTQSQHRFIYKMLHRHDANDLNELVYYLLDPSNDAGNGEGSLVSLHDQAQRILRIKEDPALRIKLTEQLVDNFQHKARSPSKRYRAVNQFIKYSIYFPPIYYWFQKIPRGNVLVVPVELLQARHQSEATKWAYLRNLTTATAFQAVADAHTVAQAHYQEKIASNREQATQRMEKAKTISDDEKATAKLALVERQWTDSNEKAARDRDAPLNDAYTVAQFNRLYRFVLTLFFIYVTVIVVVCEEVMFNV